MEMILSRTQLISGLEHEDYLVRSFFLSHFFDKYDIDPALTKAVIRALEKYGFEDPYQYPNQIKGFGHDEESFRWLVELSQHYPLTKGSKSLQMKFLEWFALAPVNLLKENWDVFVKSPWHGLFSGNDGSMTQESIARFRIKLSESSLDQCLDELDKITADCLKEKGFPSQEIARSELVCERLARDPDEVVTLVEQWLDFDFNQKLEKRHWLMGIGIGLAGLIRCDSVVGRMIDLFEYDWDWWDETIERSLIRMRTRKSMEIVLDRYPKALEDARIYLSSALEKMNPSGSESELIHLFNDEPEEIMQRNLTLAITHCCTEETLSFARKEYLENSTIGEYFEVMRALYAYRKLLGEESAELDAWEAEQFEEIESLKESWKLFTKFDGKEKKATPITKIAELPGRNDPCPCGSGKKYKKCCM